MKDEKKIALKAEGKVHEFAPDHAKALLAYPGTVWAEVPAEKVEAKALPATEPVAREAEATATTKTKK